MIRRRLPVCLYSRCITFLYGTADEVNRYMVKIDATWTPLNPQHEGRWCVQEAHGREADFIIVVKRPRYGPSRGVRAKLHGVLVHETLHCASYILRHAGLVHIQETDEAYTYYQQWLFEQCARFLP